MSAALGAQEDRLPGGDAAGERREESSDCCRVLRGRLGSRSAGVWNPGLEDSFFSENRMQVKVLHQIMTR